MPARERFDIHVIELDPAVRKVNRFRDANPDYRDGKPCVYVGMTARTPEERHEQHKSGYKSARLVKKFGIRLKPRQYRSPNPMRYEEASRMEREKARRLRKRGYGVWQN